MSNKKSEMGAAMPVAMRFTSLGVLITLIQLFAPFQSAEVQAQTAEKIEVESTFLDLSEVLNENENGSAIRLQEAVTSLKSVSASAGALILDAKRLFEKEPTAVNEARLERANAQAIALAFNALKEFRQAADEHLQATERVLGELAKARGGFSDQITKRAGERVIAEARKAQLETKLDVLTKNLDGFLDKNGNLDPELNADIEFLDWMYRHEVRTSRDVAAVKKEAERDLGKIERLEKGLREKNTDLEYVARGGTLIGQHIKKIAHWQSEAMKRRALLRRARRYGNAIPDDISKILPEVEYSILPDLGGSDLVEGENLGTGRKQRGKEILLKRRAAKAASTKETVQKKGPGKQEPAAGSKSAKVEVEVEPLSPPAPDSGVSQALASMKLKKGEGNDE